MDGLLTLSDPLFCKKEVLGQIFQTSIAGVDISIHFPQLPLFDEKNPQIGISNPLIPPEIAKTWRRGEDLLEWGYPQSYPSGNSCVDLLAISVECDETNRIEKARALYLAIKAWEKSFSDYLRITTKQNAERDRNNLSQANCCLELLGTNSIPDLVTDTIYINVPSSNSFASREQINDAILFAGTGKELKIEYQMMLSAYESRRNCQNRQAIIDSCSALELCLENYITKRAKEIDINQKLLLDKFKSLGDRIDLVKQLDKSFPTEDQHSLIVKPRNDIAHNRETYPSDETTDTLIECVERCLQLFFTGYY